MAVFLEWWTNPRFGLGLSTDLLDLTTLNAVATAITSTSARDSGRTASDRLPAGDCSFTDTGNATSGGPNPAAPPGMPGGG